MDPVFETNGLITEGDRVAFGKRQQSGILYQRNTPQSDIILESSSICKWYEMGLWFANGIGSGIGTRIFLSSEFYDAFAGPKQFATFGHSFVTTIRLASKLAS